MADGMITQMHIEDYRRGTPDSSAVFCPRDKKTPALPVDKFRQLKTRFRFFDRCSIKKEVSMIGTLFRKRFQETKQSKTFFRNKRLLFLMHKRGLRRKRRDRGMEKAIKNAVWVYLIAFFRFLPYTSTQSFLDASKKAIRTFLFTVLIAFLKFTLLGTA